MSKNCIMCNKKIGFFEKLYEDKYCKECYDKQVAKMQEMIKIENEKILISEKNYFLYTKYFWSILSNINNLPFHYQDIFKDTVKSDKFKVIELLLEEILIQLPKDYNLTDIKKITTYGRSSQIIDKVLKPYIDRELNYEKYCLITVDRQKYYPPPNNNILNDIEENSIFIDISLIF